MFKSLTVYPILLLASSAAMAVGYPTVSTQIKGVVLLETSGARSSNPSDSVADVTDLGELTQHCNRGKAIYLAEIPGKKFHCRVKRDEGKIGTVEILTRRAKAYDPVTIMLSKPPPKTFKITLLSNSEQSKISSIVENLASQLHEEDFADFMRINANSGHSQYSSLLRSIVSSNIYRLRHQAPLKILTHNKVIAIAEVGIRTNGTGWDIRYAVIDLSSYGVRTLGVLDGCIVNFIDIDRNGLPEALVNLCENTEGTSRSLVRIHPSIQVLVNRSQ